MAKAFLTHSFHCCAFKFPAQHDPLSHERFIKVIEEFKNDCKAKGYNSHAGDINAINNNFARKKKRHSHNMIDMTPNSNASKTVHVTNFFDNLHEIADYEMEGFEGTFHAPINNNHDVEAMCGNITIQ